MSKSRQDKRNKDPNVIAKREELAGKSGNVAPNMPASSAGGILAGPLATQPTMAIAPGGAGWAVGGKHQIPASGQHPAVNPFLIPKASGINVISQTYPSNYFVEWDLATHRIACDRAIKQGFTPDIATLYSWCYESSPFVQSMFRTIETAINSIPFYYCDEKGNPLDEWTQELCGKPWQMELRREMAFSFFWGFSGLNFDPINELLYKYPMQDIDPLNRMLRQNTYSFYDGVFFDQNDNLLFLQPNTNYEGFLGWMQAITRQFIQMNLNDMNWIAAGKKLAFPVFVLGYPESSSSIDRTTGLQYNPYRDEAEKIASEIGPGKAVVTPFVRLPNGEIQKNIEIQFEQTGASQKAHSIYLDFNETKKNEIRELILGGTLTADVGNSGSRALGEVQERKLRTFLKSVIEYVVAQHNSTYKKKIGRFYKNMPKGKFEIDRAQQLSIEEIVAWSGVVQANGKRLTTKFFEDNGFPADYLEDAPEPAKPEKPLSKANDGNIQNLHADLPEKKKWL